MKAITLNNGVEMPALGLGVFQTPPVGSAASSEAISHAVLKALGLV